MKRFVLLHYGFQKPTSEIMSAWGKWFEQTKHGTVENLGLGGGREISKAGTKDRLDAPCSRRHLNAQGRKPCTRGCFA